MLFVGALALVPCVSHAATIHGYVLDADGRRANGARVKAYYLPPTDQHPPLKPKLFAEGTTDAHGNFTISVDTQEVNVIIASFDHQSGAAPPSFTATVRVAMRHNRPRSIPQSAQQLLGVGRTFGYVPDAATAIKIAVSVWEPIYGRDHIASERPFQAALHDGVWTVTGSLPKGWLGGVAEADIRKADGRVLRIIHGK